MTPPRQLEGRHSGGIIFDQEGGDPPASAHEEPADQLDFEAQQSWRSSERAGRVERVAPAVQPPAVAQVRRQVDR